MGVNAPLNRLERAFPHHTIFRQRQARFCAAFGFTDSGNSEILAAWLRLAVRFGYEPAFGSLADFLRRQGRRKFLEPLYKELMASESGRRRAQTIYAMARDGYHPVATQTLDPIVRKPQP